RSKRDWSSDVCSSDLYEVNISEAEQVVEIEIVNEYVHGNIRLTKVDAEYPDNKLTGATFEVYKDTNENGKIDDGDELIGNLEERSEERRVGKECRRRG